MSFGQRLKKLREDAGFSQKKLAKLMGKPGSSGNFTLYENDSVKPSIDIIIQLCSIFKVSADWLLFGETIQNKKNEITSDPDLEQAFKTLTDLYQNHGLNVRGWAIITFEETFQKYLDEKNESLNKKKAQ